MTDTSGGTGRPILVIEDEPSVMSFVKTALERNGFAVVSADSGAAALRMLQQGDYRCVISDMRTPGGVDGADVHDWICDHRPDLHQKLIFITGDIVNEETAATLRRTGAPHLEKPFRVRQLLDIIEQTLGSAS
ncbi:MAG TPA: response regulator [Terriglobales bacterium]|nr:response regulator [Terriglobales bacterium]